MEIDELFGSSGSAGEIRTSALAALESVQGVNLAPNPPQGWVRPDYQIMSRAAYPELGKLIGKVHTFTATSIATIWNSGATVIPRYMLQSGAVIVMGAGSNDHTMFVSHDYGTSWTSKPVNCDTNPIKFGNTWLTCHRNQTSVPPSYTYSTDNAVTWTTANAKATAVSNLGGLAPAHDGTTFYLFGISTNYPSNKTAVYFKGNAIATITTEQTGPWDALFGIFYTGSNWLAFLDRTTQGAGIGLFTSTNLTAWTKVVSLTGHSSDWKEDLYKVGTRIFWRTARKYSDDLGATWQDMTFENGAQPFSYGGGPTSDGSRLYWGTGFSENNGATWKRWIFNPKFPIAQYHTVINGSAGGTVRLIGTDYATNRNVYCFSFVQAFDPDTHFQLPGSSQFTGIPFPIMKVS